MASNLITLDGIVIGQREFGESGRFIDILTDEYGVIETPVKGGGNPACSLFSLSKFCLNRRAYPAQGYSVNSANQTRSFFNVAADIDAFALAGYFAQAAKAVFLPEQGAEQGESGFLRFFAVTLYELETRRLPLPIVKYTFELRLCEAIGFSPRDGFGELPGGAQELSLSEGEMSEIRRIIFLPSDMVYKTGTLFERLIPLSEKYLTYHLERVLPALKYYHDIDFR